MPRKMTRFVWVVFILLDLKSNSRGWKVRLQYRGKDRGGGGGLIKGASETLVGGGGGMKKKSF